MDGLQSSFIPKKPIDVDSRTYGDRGVSLISIISVIIFLSAATGSAGVYLYQKTLVKKLEDKKAELKKVDRSDYVNSIRELRRLDVRLTEGTKLLDNHVAATALLSVLESMTLKSVSFKSFSMEASVPTSSGDTTAGVTPGVSSVKVTLEGVAKNYESVAVQSNVFSDTKEFKDPIFSDVALDDKGAVNFKVSMLIDPMSMRYRTTLESKGGNNPSTQ